jgi:hypothetical protein
MQKLIKRLEKEDKTLQQLQRLEDKKVYGDTGYDAEYHHEVKQGIKALKQISKQSKK